MKKKKLGFLYVTVFVLLTLLIAIMTVDILFVESPSFFDDLAFRVEETYLNLCETFHSFYSSSSDPSAPPVYAPKVSPLKRINPPVMVSTIERMDDILDQAYEKQLYLWVSESASFRYHSQGACTDGIYIWSGSDTPHLIRRTHILTGETSVWEFSDEEWLCGHINDMTYNPYTNRIYAIAYENGDGASYDKIAVINPDSLLQEEIIHLQAADGKPYRVHGIAYDRLNRCYYTAANGNNGCNYLVFDDDFHYLRTIKTTRYENYVLQGIETDGRYIYRSLSAADGSQWFAIYDLVGNFINLVLLPIPKMINELEVAMYDWHGNWYANVASHATTSGEYSYYRIGFQKDVDYSKGEQFQTFLQDVLLTYKH